MSAETDDVPGVNAFKGTVDDVLARLETDRQSGLTHQQATDRLRLYGRNELTAEAPVQAWRTFLAQFSDVLVILLIIAALVSAALWLIEHDAALPYEAIAIFAIVLLNAVMGYLQQSRAEKAVAALRQMSAAQAKVIRDGERQSVPAAEIVPGDVIVIPFLKETGSGSNASITSCPCLHRGSALTIIGRSKSVAPPGSRRTGRCLSPTSLCAAVPIRYRNARAKPAARAALRWLMTNRINVLRPREC